MSWCNEYVSITAEIDIGSGETLVKNTPEFQVSCNENVCFEISKQLKNLYPYISEHIYIEIVKNALESNADEIFEDLTQYSQNGHTTDFHSPKSVKLKFHYRKAINMEHEPFRVPTPNDVEEIFKKLSKNNDYISTQLNSMSESESVFFEKREQSKKNLINIKNFARNTFSRLFALLSIFLLVGIFYSRAPDGYYMLVRIITCATCVYSAVKFKLEWAKWIFGILAVVYNPVLPVRLDDEALWGIVNFATLVYVWIALFKERKIEQNGKSISQ